MSLAVALCSAVAQSFGDADESPAAPATRPRTSADLRLVPYPKHAEAQTGSFPFGPGVNVTVSDSPAARQAVAELREELKLNGGAGCAIDFEPAVARAAGGEPRWTLRASPKDAILRGSRPAPRPREDREEGYALSIDKGWIGLGANHEAGLVRGIQTLRQLVRANSREGTIPCVTIEDWPSLKYRGFSDDITRGPSPKLETLEREVRLSALLKMNFFTYYLEHQFAYAKHPEIGPKDGSLTPDELRKLVDYGKSYGVEIIGNQQSFGHFAEILKYDRYKPLAETTWVLNPTNEDTYRFLDDLYSEQAPLTEAPFFNVCCDETEGLGTGPSKPLAERIGVGGVYARHIRRIHDILKDKYHKRMMMWGDIILQHPEKLSEIPKDTVMLSWGYDARPSFDSAITPFANSGYEFFVCPGVSCWNRILPDFGTAVTNIRNYVRDGVKHGALGMLNTTWDDDGENFDAYNWHGVAWGAECAWNGSATSIEDFNRRIGGMLFGEDGDEFGQAITLLGKTHRLPGYEAMFDGVFWKTDFGRLPTDAARARQQADALLEIAEPAITHLIRAKEHAKFNVDILDAYIFGAQRMRLMARRQIAFLAAARAYEQAEFAANDAETAMPFLRTAAKILRGVRSQHQTMRDEYIVLWSRENRPYALDRVTRRFDELIGYFDGIASKLDGAAKALSAGRGLPSARDVGLEVVELGVRRTRPASIVAEPLQPKASWPDTAFRKRLGITLETGDAPRCDQPVEVDLVSGVGAKGPVRLFALQPNTPAPLLVPCQLTEADGRIRLAFLAAGPMPPGGKRDYLLYFDATDASEAAAFDSAARCTDGPNGAKWLENNKVRLLVGPGGGHIYRWEMKELAGKDLTEPGEKDWAGFADLYGPQRNARNRIEAVLNGPALARIRCTDDLGTEKTISLWAGASWAEVTLSSGVGWFWCYDDVRLMGSAGATPGTYLFSDGQTGKVKAPSSTPDCQVRRSNVVWSAKFAAGGPLLALLTPEVAAAHVVGPGGGMGGVGLEGSPPVAHFVIYGGACPTSPSPKDMLDSLRAATDFSKPVAITVHGVQGR